jgi:hypothetical protein
VLEVTFACSDGDCAEEHRVLVSTPRELDQLCDCGYGLVLIQIAEVQLV